MDLDDDKTTIMVEEEDRISNLPEDLIHRILSFLDMKYAVQTITLSQKWKLLWTSIPRLNLNSRSFRTLPMFAKFVKHVLSLRNNHTEVSAVELKFTGAVTQFFVRSIINYAYSHNLRELAITYSTKKCHEFPQHLFSSHTLKHLTLATNQHFYFQMTCCMPNSAWDFPALETLNLSNMTLSYGRGSSPNLFSKCVNLKDLTLHQLSLLGVEVFNICAPELSNLTITGPFVFPKAFNVVAPKLENLTASVSCTMNGVTSFYLKLADQAHSTQHGGFDSLDKVNLSFSSRCKKEEAVPILRDLFQKLHRAKFLILNVDIIEALSSCLDELSREPCPFDNLKCLKIEKQKDRIATMPTQVRNYLLESSPSATVIMDLSQPLKRSRQQAQKDTMAKKAKLETEVQQQEALLREKITLEAQLRMKDEFMSKKQAMLEAQLRAKDEILANKKAMLEALLLRLIETRMAELQVQVESENPDYDIIRLIGSGFKTVMGLILEEEMRLVMEARFWSEYEEMKARLVTRLDASQWATIQTQLRNVLPPAP